MFLRGAVAQPLQAHRGPRQRRQPLRSACRRDGWPLTQQPRQRGSPLRALDGRAPQARLLGASDSTETADLQQQQQPEQLTQQQAQPVAAQLQADGKASAASAGSVQAALAALPDEGEVWRQWCEHFEAQDEAAAERQQLAQRLQRAVASEAYPVAAMMRERLDELDAGDTVAVVQRRMAEALAQEDYAAAAQLRDEGCAGLAGWWAGSGEDDPFGHLLHVTSEYGRWTGKVYTARDLSEFAGWRDDTMPVRMGSTVMPVPRSSLVARAGGGSGAADARLRPSLDSLGTPLLELFVRPAAEAADAAAGAAAGDAVTLLESRAVALRPAGGEDAASSPQDAEGRLVVASVADQASGQEWTLQLLVAEGGERILMQRLTRGSSAPSSMVLGLGGGSKGISISGGAASLGGGVAAGSKRGVDGAPQLGDKIQLSKFDDGEMDEVRATLAALAGGDEGSSAGAGAADRPRSGVLLSSLGANLRSTGGADLLAALAAGEGATAESSGTEAEGDAEGAAAGGAPAEIEVLGSSEGNGSVSIESAEGSLSDEDGDLDVLGGGAGDEPGGADAAAAAAVLAGGARPRLGASWRDVDDGEEVVELQRCPADLEMQGRDKFLLSIASEEELTAGSSSSSDVSGSIAALATAAADALASTSGSAAASRSRSTLGDVFGDGVAAFGRLLDARARSQPAKGAADAAASLPPSPAEPLSGEVMLAAADAAVSQLTAVGQLPDGARVLGLADCGITTVGDLERVIRSEQASGRGASSAAPAMGGLGGFAAAAAARATSNGSRAGGAGGAAALTERLAGGPPLGGDGALAAVLSSRHFSYRRLGTRHPKTDPFTGMYVGAFGPHGSELLQLSRGIDETTGEELVVGMKLTGDANVPAGELSFRARVSRRRRLPVDEMYPAELGVVARYPGEGRVAQPGYKNARWVEGELLQFANGGNPLTGNAQLGFVWAVPGAKRFLILLNRVDLE